MSQIKPRILSLIVFALISEIAAFAHYTIYETSRNVLVKQGSKTLAANTNMQLNAADLLIIPENAKVKILDSRNSQIYESISSGQLSVTRIIFDASKRASNNSNTLHDNLLNGDKKDETGVVLIEKGKVTRSLNIFDPTVEQMQVDIDLLSKKIYSILSDSTHLHEQTVADTPITIRHARNGHDGLNFMVENSMPHPVYFNVVKLSPESSLLEISEVGQPVGSYVLQPDQALTRTQRSGIDPDSEHILIVTDHYFDIDNLLTNLNFLIANHTPVDSVTQDFTLIVRQL